MNRDPSDTPNRRTEIFRQFRTGKLLKIVGGIDKSPGCRYGILMRGRTFALSPARRLMSDIGWLHRRVRMSVLQRNINLSQVSAARSDARTRIPWCVIVAKAWAMVTMEMPFLRASIEWTPFARLFMPDGTVGMIMVSRTIGGEDCVLPARFKNIHDRTLVTLAAEIVRHQAAPVEQIDFFRRVLRLSAMPTFVRRMLWTAAYCVGRFKANYFGTFAVSLLGEHGASIPFPLSPTTTFVNIGTIGTDGCASLCVAFDHAVVDGIPVAKAMQRFVEILNGPICDELHEIGSQMQKPALEARASVYAQED